MTRTAISPRLAMRTFLNIRRLPWSGFDFKKRLAVFDRVTVGHERFHYFAGVRRDYVLHDLHRFDRTDGLAGGNNYSFDDHGWARRRIGTEKGTDHGGFDEHRFRRARSSQQPDLRRRERQMIWNGHWEQRIAGS